jgi:hypothetical protein
VPKDSEIAAIEGFENDALDGLDMELKSALEKIVG